MFLANKMSKNKAIVGRKIMAFADSMNEFKTRNGVAA